MPKIRIVIIDDSAVVHALLEKALRQIDEFEIAGKAFDGKSGVKIVTEKKPDIVIMDINMPQMGGLEAIEEIMDLYPVPIIVFSAASQEIVNLGYEAIGRGALDIVEKPQSLNFEDFLKIINNVLFHKIKAFAGLKLVRRKKKIKVFEDVPKRVAQSDIIHQKPQYSDENFPIIGIAASTGGPQTIRQFIDRIAPNSLSAPIVIIQHMAEGFISGFANWLSLSSRIPVTIAKENEFPKKENIYIAPGHIHLAFNKKGFFTYLYKPPLGGIRPSADIFFESLAETYRERAIAIVLTGMGNDGAKGLLAIKKYNGYIIAQDQESSIIFGMPKAAIEMGIVDEIVSIDKLYPFIISLLRQ